VTVLAGDQALTGGTLILSVTDGTNIGTGTITLDVNVDVSYNTFARSFAYGQSFMSGSAQDTLGDTLTDNRQTYFGDSLEFGYSTNVSNNGLVATFGMPHRTTYRKGDGAIAVYVNTSGNVSNNTSWAYLDECTVDVTSYANNGGMSSLRDTDYWSLGVKSHCLNHDGSMIASCFMNENETSNLAITGRCATIIWQKSGSNYNIHSMFNPYDLSPVSSYTGTNNHGKYDNLNLMGRYIDCDHDMERIAVVWSRRAVNAAGTNMQDSGVIEVYKRTGTTWTHEQSLEPFGVSPNAFQASPSAIAIDSQVTMSADGSRIMCNSALGGSGANDGIFWVWDRTGTTWAESFNDIGGGRQGYGGSMSKDGNHILVSGNYGSTARFDYWSYAASSWSYQGHMFTYDPYNAHPLGAHASNPVIAHQNDLWGQNISLNYDGTICTVEAKLDDGYNNTASVNSTNTGAIYTYKRYNTTGVSGSKPDNGSYWWYDQYFPLCSDSLGIGENPNYPPKIGVFTGQMSGRGDVIVTASNQYTGEDNDNGNQYLSGKGLIIQPT
jgi:hypothetical protein